LGLAKGRAKDWYLWWFNSDNFSESPINRPNSPGLKPLSVWARVRVWSKNRGSVQGSLGKGELKSSDFAGEMTDSMKKNRQKKERFRPPT